MLAFPADRGLLDAQLCNMRPAPVVDGYLWVRDASVDRGQHLLACCLTPLSKSTR